MGACEIGIPKILHFVWLSKKDAEAKDIHHLFCNNALKTAALIDLSAENWIINLWVDQKSQVLPKVKELESNGFNIKNIYEESLFEREANLLDPSNSLYQKQIFDESYNLGIRIDIVKYQVLKKYGGIVNDFNFVYERLPTEEELNSSSLILYKVQRSFKLESYPENCFMATTPEHPFIKEVQVGVVNKAANEDFCLSKNPKFPQDTLNLLQSKLPGFSEQESRSKKIYCTSITIDPVGEIDLSKFLGVIITKVYQEICYSEHCFGYDALFSDGTLLQQTWLEI